MARFGGDEFGILVDRLADEDEAVAISDRVAAAFADPFLLGGAEHFISASLGIAVALPSTRDPVDPESLHPRRRRRHVPGEGARPGPLRGSSTTRCAREPCAASRPSASCATRSSATS